VLFICHHKAIQQGGQTEFTSSKSLFLPEKEKFLNAFLILKKSVPKTRKTSDKNQQQPENPYHYS
jgi:hypothetical protein